MNRYFTHPEILGGKVVLKLDHYQPSLPPWVGDVMISLILGLVILAAVVYAFRG